VFIQKRKQATNRKTDNFIFMELKTA